MIERSVDVRGMFTGTDHSSTSAARFPKASWTVPEMPWRCLGDAPGDVSETAPPDTPTMPPNPWVGGRCPRPGICALLHGPARGPPSPRPMVRSRRNSSGAFDTPEEMRRSCEPFFSSSYWFRVPARCWRARLSRRSLRFQRFRRFPQPPRPTTALARTIHTSVRAISSRRRSPFAAAASDPARISRRAPIARVGRRYAIAMRLGSASASDLSRSRSNQVRVGGPRALPRRGRSPCTVHGCS